MSQRIGHVARCIAYGRASRVKPMPTRRTKDEKAARHRAVRRLAKLIPVSSQEVSEFLASVRERANVTARQRRHERHQLRRYLKS